MSTAGPDDYLALEPLIIARLQDQIPDLAANVRPLADANVLADGGGNTTPALLVIYAGEAIDYPENMRQATGTERIDQTWAVVVSVRSSTDPRAGSAARAIAGPLITRVIRTLSGWRPDEGYETLRRIDAPFPSGYENGWLFYPLAWIVRLPYFRANKTTGT
jgi:hypothetical protein